MDVERRLDVISMMSESPVGPKSVKSDGILKDTPEKLQYNKYLKSSFNDRGRANGVVPKSHRKNLANEYSLPDNSLNGSLNLHSEKSPFKSQSIPHKNPSLIYDQNALRDVFDQEFLRKLKESIKDNEQGHNVGESQNLEMKHFAKAAFTRTTNTNIRTNGTTPDTRTPIRSPLLKAEGVQDKSKFQKKIDYEKGKFKYPKSKHLSLC